MNGAEGFRLPGFCSIMPMSYFAPATSFSHCSAVLASGNFIDSLITGNMRFVGASVLHVMSSAIVGLSLAFSFYKPKIVRRHMVIIGILLATVLHTLFNLSIISSSGSNMFVTFLILWFSVIGLLLFFEKIKRLSQVGAV